MIHKKSGISEHKYMLHSAEDCFGNLSDQNYVRDGMGGPMGSRAEAVKQYKKSENKRKKELEALKKQKNAL